MSQEERKVNTITVLLVCDPGSEKSAVIENLIRNQVSLKLINTLSDDESCNKVKSITPGLIWIDLDRDDPGDGLSTLRILKHLYSGACYWTSCQGSKPDVVRTAFRFGAADCFDVLDLMRSPAALSAALERLGAIKQR